MECQQGFFESPFYVPKNPRGLVFAFGAGGSGQLGSGGIAESEPYPKVVETLKEIGC